jgi:hypothetical protein
VLRISNSTFGTPYKACEFAVVYVMIRYIWNSRDFFSILVVAMKVIRGRNWAKLNIKQQQKVCLCPWRYALCALSCRKQATEERCEGRLCSRLTQLCVSVCLSYRTHTNSVHIQVQDTLSQLVLLCCKWDFSGFMHSAQRKICAAPQAKWRTRNFQVENISIVQIRTEIEIYTQHYERLR